MALTNIKTTATTEVPPVEELVVKKSGSYEYVDTPNEGIKKIVSKQGGYLVFLDYGRKLKMNKKTGKQEYKQSQRYLELTPSYQDHVDNHIRHLLDYMADMETCKITTIDIENYYAFQLSKCSRCDY